MLVFHECILGAKAELTDLDAKVPSLSTLAIISEVKFPEKVNEGATPKGGGGLWAGGGSAVEGAAMVAACW